ncbi:divalent-cation tolerance protein CutA [Actinocorallia lasiicapitis]
MADAYVQVTTTIDEQSDAAELARSAVEERLAACAQVVGPITATYWWEGEVETADEWMVLFKTTADRFQELAVHINDHHSYETPEIIATPVVAGSAEYLGWITDQTAEVDDDPAELLDDDDLEIVD